MIAHGELVCDIFAEYFERRHSLNARQTWRRVGSSLTAAAEGNNNFLLIDVPNPNSAPDSMRFIKLLWPFYVNACKLQLATR